MPGPRTLLEVRPAMRRFSDVLTGVGALPALAILLPLLLLARASGYSWRIALLLASTGWGVAVVAITELLSAGSLLSFRPLVLAWGVTLAGVTLFAAKRARSRGWSRSPVDEFARTPTLAALLLLQLAIVALVGVIAWAGAPNNWDSHTYHLARVQHWLQNQSVAHYPTSIEQQVYAGPWAEFVLAHLMLLTGGDRLANFVQWFAYVGSAIAVSVIARRLGARPIGQAAASACCLTLPMAILQGSSTQNDLVVSFWLASFVALSCEALRDDEGVSWLLLSGAAAALGLGMLTKGTTYVYAPPFVVWFCVALYRRRGARATLGLVGAAAGIVLLINAPHYTRNAIASRSPLGPSCVPWSGREICYQNKYLTIVAPISNVVRSVALQLGAPDGDRTFGAEPVDRAIRAVAQRLRLPSSQRWNEWVLNAASSFLEALGIDPNDPSTTWDARPFRVPASGWNFEDTAGNPLHALLFAGMLLWLLVTRDATARRLIPYVGCCAAGFVLFNALFSWQVYHSRLHLPLLVLMSAAFGTALDRAVGERWTACIAAALVVVSTPWLFNNLTRPLLGETSVLRVPRFDQYFRQLPELRDQFLSAAELVKDSGCRDVAVVVDNDAWEYPLWRALEEVGWRACIVHTQVANYTAAIAQRSCAAASSPPCVEVRITTTSVLARPFAHSERTDRRDLGDQPSPQLLRR